MTAIDKTTPNTWDDWSINGWWYVQNIPVWTYFQQLTFRLLIWIHT